MCLFAAAFLCRSNTQSSSILLLASHRRPLITLFGLSVGFPFPHSSFLLSWYCFHFFNFLLNSSSLFPLVLILGLIPEFHQLLLFFFSLSLFLFFFFPEVKFVCVQFYVTAAFCSCSGIRIESFGSCS